MSKRQFQPHDLVFFLDENLGGKKVSSVLREAGFHVEIHQDHFPRGTADEEWLPEIGRRGWILLTQDKSIRYRKNEQRALIENDVQAFFVSAKSLRGEEIGALIVQMKPRIFRILKKNKPPFIAMLNRHTVILLHVSKS